MSSLDAYLSSHKERFEEELCELLRIPSVSADSRHRADMARAAQWVAGQFEALGLTTEVIPTAGHPLVFAQSAAVAGTPTALVYGHYDVQPPDPLSEWTTPPFEPTRRGENLYARGATDDKGQMLTHIKSAEAWIRAEGGLPLNLKFLIEGEEEVGSDNLYQFIDANLDKLACDVAVISDSGQFGPGQPAITYGLKGLVYFELKLTGPKQDLHSGSFGGAVTNPANALCQMLASLRDQEGRVVVPGFYDDVVPLSERERQQFAALNFDDAAFMQKIGVEGMTGEAGYTSLERRWARPTFDINGLTSGYQGEGAKTILPARASAKFSFRLVPNQNPEKIAEAIHVALAEICPPGLKFELVRYGASPGVLVSLDSPYISAAERAIEHGFGRRPVFIREGGSIPVVTAFRNRLGVDTLLLGWGLDDDNAHSPNEKFNLSDFHRGIKASADLWRRLAALRKAT